MASTAGPQLKYADSSTDELMRDLNRLPLFMTELDQTDGEGGSNLMLEALQALAYEGSPVEIARNFKSQGNERFQVKSFKDAVEFYTKAIMTGLGKPEVKPTQGEGADSTNSSRIEELPDNMTAEQEKEIAEAYFDSKATSGTKINLNTTDTSEAAAKDAKELADIVTSCYLNRAACNLELQNYRRVINDCAEVLKRQPANAKAYYRTAKACLAIDKISEAQECIERGLKLEPKSSYFKELGIKVFQRENYLLKLEQQQNKREIMSKHVVHI
ncbi:hypothetical protein BZA70DRAFT_285024 [Myxozyma melibiosi]|uniref:Uncharacterized protein n=1 Tax=Myxozyma melibiosi TaxID=54550 RepID=A0ABR1EYX4_9ASCO